MRKFGILLALLSAFSMTVLPVVPSYAASPDKATAQKIAAAKSGAVVVLSQAQMAALQQSNPALHAKLATANEKGTVPRLTAAERRIVTSLTQQNLNEMKAGFGGAWIVVAIVAAVVLFHHHKGGWCPPGGGWWWWHHHCPPAVKAKG
jgi:hypothetical protein